MSGELAKALAAAQKAMPAVDETGKSNYGAHMTLDHLIAKTLPPLNANGLAISQFPAVSDLGQPVLRTIILHESGEQLSADTPLFLPQQTMQALGAAITYARRYAWASACAVASEKDDDGDSISKPAQTKSAPKAPPDSFVRMPSAPKAPSPEAPQPGSDVPIGETALLDLARKYALVNKEFDVQTVRAAMDKVRDQPNYSAWLRRQVARMEKNIVEARADAEAKAKFPIPSAASEKAA